MAISDDYTIRQYRESILDFSETERLDLFLRVAASTYLDPWVPPTTILDLFLLMDHPGKDFIWHRYHRDAAVFVSEDHDSIKRLQIEPNDGLWFEFWFDQDAGHWQMAEVNKVYAQLSINPKKLYVMPDADKEES